MSAEIPAARVRLIDRIILAARGLTRKSSGTDSRSFLKTYFLGVAQEDLMARQPEYLARVALAHRRAGEQRTAGRPVVTILDAHRMPRPD